MNGEGREGGVGGGDNMETRGHGEGEGGDTETRRDVHFSDPKLPIPNSLFPDLMFPVPRSAVP